MPVAMRQDYRGDRKWRENRLLSKYRQSDRREPHSNTEFRNWLQFRRPRYKDVSRKRDDRTANPTRTGEDERCGCKEWMDGELGVDQKLPQRQRSIMQIERTRKFAHAEQVSKPAMTRSAIRSPTRGAVGALVAVVMGVTLDELDDINASPISAPNVFRD